MMVSQGRVESNRGGLAGLAEVGSEVGASVGEGDRGNGERLLMALTNAMRWWTNQGGQHWWVAEQGGRPILGDGESETPLTDPNLLIANPLIHL
jgi:hypothetical protein